MSTHNLRLVLKSADSTGWGTSQISLSNLITPGSYASGTIIDGNIGQSGNNWTLNNGESGTVEFVVDSDVLYEINITNHTSNVSVDIIDSDNEILDTITSSSTTYNIMVDSSSRIQRVSKVNGADGGGEDSFGGSMTHNNDYVFIGRNTRHDDNVPKGAVNVYKMENNELLFQQLITSPNPFLFENFGSAVAANNNYLAVGVPSLHVTDNRDGNIFIYELSGNTWVLHQNIIDSNGQAQVRFFGQHIAMSETHMVVGFLINCNDNLRQELFFMKIYQVVTQQSLYG